MCIKWERDRGGGGVREYLEVVPFEMVYERAFLHARASTGRGRNWYRGEVWRNRLLEARGEFASIPAERTSVIFPRRKKKEKRERYSVYRLTANAISLVLAECIKET